MAAGSITDGGVNQRQPSAQVRKVIQSIKEIVGNHSDDEIYDVLKESNMDPNETAQKLLNQVPFLEVKRKKDKRKEFTGHKDISETRRNVDYNLKPMRPPIIRDIPVGGGDHNRNMRQGGPNREVRVVRQYRVKQIINRNVNDQVQNTASRKEQAISDLPDTSSVGILTDQKQSATGNSKGATVTARQPHDSVTDHTKVVRSTSTRTTSRVGKARVVDSTFNSPAQKEGHDNSKEHSSFSSSSSLIGVYSSASDPVHVPSPATRPARTVGAIRRETRVVGAGKHLPNQQDISSATPSGSVSVPSLSKDTQSIADSSEQSGSIKEASQMNQVVVTERVVSKTPITGSSSGIQHNAKVHQQSTGHPKAPQCTKEWKPKSVRKPTISSRTESTPLGSSTTDNANSSDPVDISNLSKELSTVDVIEERHVIIPQHLQVPESEYTRLTFGSFGAEFDSTKSVSSTSNAYDNAEQSSDEPSVSVTAIVPESSNGNMSTDDDVDRSAGQTAVSRSESPALVAESEQQPPSGNSESLDHHNNESYGEIGLVQSQSQPFISAQIPTSLPGFSAYSQVSYDVPFIKTVGGDNIPEQGLTSPSENLNLHATNMVLGQPLQQSVQQQQQQQQQQSTQHQQHQAQAVTNMYPQVHFPHYPNFMQYRHVISPVYVPPMAMPNYSNNAAYTHPSNGNNYILMPGGGSHVAAGGMKYAASQYKQVPSGTPLSYGNYNPSGFTVNTPSSAGVASGLEDASRIKYKDNNHFVQNPQADTSDMWIQTQRDLQTAAYYNISGQPPQAAAAAFMPPAHASFNPAAAAQSSHMHYPNGLYQTPNSLNAPHHLVHQSSHASGVGAANITHGAQLGAYQQTQLNWPGNF